MEASTVVTGVPASRQKNCNGCVQAKRRCNRRTPICSRCAEKKLPCIYTKIKMTSRLNKHVVKPSRGIETLPVESLACSFSVPPQSLVVDPFEITPMDYRPDTTAATASESALISAMDPSSTTDIPMDSFADLIGSESLSPWDQWLIPSDQGAVTERPNSPVDEGMALSYQKMTGFCDHIEPWHLHDPKSTLHYILGRVKGFTSEVAARNATPFLHGHLYRAHVPQCILSCFTVNVLYAKRTPESMAMVMRALHSNVRELVDSEAGRAMATPAEKLARAQALFLYQIIRLFDGDVNLRAQGEKDMPLLQTWLVDLCRVRDNLADVVRLEDSMMRKQPPKDWEAWIFSESMRRTIVMAYSVIALYELMKDSENKDGTGPWAYNHRWTLSRYLWDSDSCFEFDRMWKQKPHFIVTNYSFENFLKYGRGEDVDEFAEILLTVYIGVDGTKEFISAHDIK